MKKPNFKDLIIGETEDYLIINKPPQISSLDDRFDPFNIKSLAREYNEDLTLCHRLDKDTSGVLVLSKHQDAYRHMAIQLENRKVEKEYHAVVDGTHEIRDEWIDEPLGDLRRGRVYVDYGSGKPSLTYVTLLKAYRNYTLLVCKPVTGRTHQIRAHLSHVGCPITGDESYGGKFLYLSQLKRNYNIKKGSEEQPVMRRFALHAYSIIFEDRNGEDVKFEAPYPKDFMVLVKQLEKYA